MTRNFFLSFWSVIAGLGLLDWILASANQMRVRDLGAGLNPPAILMALSAIFWVVFDGRYRRFSHVCHVVALNMMAAYITIVLSYCAAANSHPLIDHVLNRLDLLLGFDWLRYYRFVSGSPWLKETLTLGYASMAWQFAATAIYFAFLEDRRLQDLMWVLLIGLLVSIGLFWLLPAQNPLDLYGIKGTNADDWARTIDALRSGPGFVLDLSSPLGLISFPSYHTMVAVALIHAHWGRNWRCALTLPLNAILIVSTLSVGAHYLCDTLAGIAIGAAIICLVRWGGAFLSALSRWRRSLARP